MAPYIISNLRLPRSAASYKSFYSLREEQVVRINSPVGQAQYILDDLAGYVPKEEWLLLCRFANTVYDDQGVHNLLKLGRHVYNARFEDRNGYASPKIAREIEKEIVLRTVVYCAQGWDLTPALKLLEDYEGTGPVFTQPERNLLLRYAFAKGDICLVAEIARQFLNKQCTRKQVFQICQEIEQIELEWAGLTSMDGLKFMATRSPGFNIDFHGCESSQKRYPPFAHYPNLNLPTGTVVLENGTLLFPVSCGWWRSGMRKVDQTFTCQRYYRQTKSNVPEYKIADAEYSL